MEGPPPDAFCALVVEPVISPRHGRRPRAALAATGIAITSVLALHSGAAAPMQSAANPAVGVLGTSTRPALASPNRTSAGSAAFPTAVPVGGLAPVRPTTSSGVRPSAAPAASAPCPAHAVAGAAGMDIPSRTDRAVIVMVSITNVSSAPCALIYADQVVIRNASGRSLFIQGLRSANSRSAWNPGQRLVDRFAWDGQDCSGSGCVPAAAGSYTASVTWTPWGITSTLGFTVAAASQPSAPRPGRYRG